MEPGERLVGECVMVVASTTVVAVAAVLESQMSLRTTFRLRFFELLVDSPTVAVGVAGAGDRIGEVIAECCCDCCGIAGERILSKVCTLVGVLDGVVVVVVGVRVGAEASAPSNRRFFGVTTSSAARKSTSPSVLFFFLEVDDGDEKLLFVRSCNGRRSGFGLFISPFHTK